MSLQSSLEAEDEALALRSKNVSLSQEDNGSTDSLNCHNKLEELEGKSDKISLQIPWKYLHVKSLSKSLHLAALSSLKGELVELSNHLKLIQADKEFLRKQVAKQQVEKLQIQKDVEDRYEKLIVQYEDRITELQGVIAELRKKKKMEEQRIDIIREEEDEFDESNGLHSICKNADCDNELNCLCHNRVDGAGGDLNQELSRVVSELENAIDEHRKLTVSSRNKIEKVTGIVYSLEDKGIQVSESTDVKLSKDFSSADMKELENQICDLNLIKHHLQQQNSTQEIEVNQLRTKIDDLQNERDHLKQKVDELQLSRIQCREGLSSNFKHRSVLSLADRSESQFHSAAAAVTDAAATIPVAKVAELKKLKTGRQNRFVLGAEISLLGLPNSQLAEHLAHSLQQNSSVEEMLQSLQHRRESMEAGSCELAIAKIQELEIEQDRLKSKVDHLRAQNDLLNLTLAESKNHLEHTTVLLGKYESNNTALQIALNYSDQALEISEVIVNLLDTELTLLTKYPEDGSKNTDVVTAENAHMLRETVEATAKKLLLQLDHCNGRDNPWEGFSSNSRPESSDYAEFTKLDEHRLREHLCHFKVDQNVVKQTIVELESIHLDSDRMTVNPPDAQRLDLENAVLIQELMATKEEKSELSARNYTLEKEKAALEYSLNRMQSSSSQPMSDERALFPLPSPHLSYVLRKTSSEPNETNNVSKLQSYGTETIPDSARIALDLSDALQNEQQLQLQVQQLTNALEKLTKASNFKQQQSAAFVNELKQANSALVFAFEKARKKYLEKTKKMEIHMQQMTEQHKTQMELMRQKLAMMEKKLQGNNPGLR